VRRASAATILREPREVVIIRKFRTVPAHWLFCFAASRPVRAHSACSESASVDSRIDVRTRSGQVAQVVERSPEKAGVGGSTPSLATISFNRLQAAGNVRFQWREPYANMPSACPDASQIGGCSSNFQISRAVLPVRAMCCRASFA
jgi:hypothetical protein